MWHFLRRLFLWSLGLGVLAATALVTLAWHVAPGKVLGVGWVWLAGAFILGAAVMVLNAALDLRQHPAPPDVPASAEVRRWIFHLILIFLVASVFAVVVGIPIVLTRALTIWSEALLGRWPEVAYTVGFLAVFAMWMGWFMGVLMGSAWLGERNFTQWFRRHFDRLIAPSPKDVIALLQNAPLPERVKADLTSKVQLRGLTREMVQEIQDAIAPYIEAADDGAVLSRFAALSQSLAVWQETHPDDEDLSTSAFS